MKILKYITSVLFSAVLLLSATNSFAIDKLHFVIGGGAGGGNGGHPAGAGGNGVVRIVWGTINGMTREFPNQGVNKTDEYPGLGGNTPTKYGTQRMC